MRLKEFIYVFLKSLNPFGYSALLTRRKRDAITYFVYLIIFTSIISTAFMIPRLSGYRKEFSKLEYLNITGIDAKTTEPIVLLSSPRIIIDLKENSTTDAYILITNDEIYWKKLDVHLFSWSFFSKEKKDIGEYSDLVDNFTRFGDLYWIIVVFLIPSLFFFILMFNTIKYILVIVLSVVVAIFTKKKVVSKVKAIFYSITILVVLDIVSKIFRLSVLPILIYILYLYLILKDGKEKVTIRDN